MWEEHHKRESCSHCSSQVLWEAFLGKSFLGSSHLYLSLACILNKSSCFRAFLCCSFSVRLLQMLWKLLTGKQYCTVVSAGKRVLTPWGEEDLGICGLPPGCSAYAPLDRAVLQCCRVPRRTWEAGVAPQLQTQGEKPQLGTGLQVPICERPQFKVSKRLGHSLFSPFNALAFCSVLVPLELAALAVAEGSTHTPVRSQVLPREGAGTGLALPVFGQKSTL